MSPETWLAFALASFVVLVIPGPTLLLVVGEAARNGRRSIPALAVGVMLGDFLAMSVSLVGLGTLIAASAEMFSLFKWFAAAYLVYLGVRRWMEAGRQAALPEVRRHKQMLFQAFVVTALNPKSIAFFVAFLPTFIDPGSPLVPQVLIIELTFLLLAGLNATAYGLAATRTRQLLERRNGRIWADRLGGTVLIGAGCLVMAMERN